MPISEHAEVRMVDAIRARNRQDKQHPMLINIKDGRLIPNVVLLRKNPDYRVYMGDVKAPLHERLMILETQGLREREPVGSVIDTLPQTGEAMRAGLTAVVPATDDRPPFDIGKADRDALVKFASENYGAALDPETHLMTLRAQVRALAKARGDIASATGDLG